MKRLDEMISMFDGLIVRSLPPSDVETRAREFVEEANMRGNALNRSVYEAYDAIDTKATAILQHVSIMIAVTGILYSQSSAAIFKLVFGVETLLYVILALCCLRLFMMQHHSGQLAEPKNVVIREAFLDLVAKLTFFVSIVLVVTFLIELVFFR